jgi:hypothetical protein
MRRPQPSDGKIFTMCLTRLGLHLARRWVGVVERAERKDCLLTIIPAVAGQYAHAILPLQDQLHGKISSLTIMLPTFSDLALWFGLHLPFRLVSTT